MSKLAFSSTLATAGAAVVIGLLSGRLSMRWDDGATGVRLYGPQYFEARGAGSAEPLSTSLILEYRLSPAFQQGGSLRVFLGYSDAQRVYFHNGSLDWSGFNLADPAAPDYVTVRFSRPGASFHLAQPGTGPLAHPYLGFHVENVHGAGPGDWARIAIGDRRAGSPGWRLPLHESTAQLLVQEADPGSSAWRTALPASDFPTLRVGGVRADRFVVTTRSTAAPGETVEVTFKPVQNEDSFYVSSPLVREYEGEILLRGSDPGMALPRRLRMTAGDDGVAVVRVTLPDAPGVYEVEAMELGNPAVRGRSNPVLVRASFGPGGAGRGLYWGSLHNHTIASGHGIESPEFGYRYARDEADLDFYALTDHCRDRLALDQFHWGELKRLGARFSVPGEFVGFSGYEWTNAQEGHRHVVFKNAEAVDLVPCERLSTGNTLASTFADLGTALADHDAIFIPHHSAWMKARPMNWGIVKDDPRQPLVEIYSWHGSSEYYGNPLRMHNDPREEQPPGRGTYVQEALANGYKLGFTADSDNHKGRAGSNNGGRIPLGHRDEPGLYARMGIVGVYADDLSRDGIWEGLRARRTIATTGARILGSYTVHGNPIGSSAVVTSPPAIRGWIRGTDVIEEVVVLRSGGEVVHRQTPGTRSVSLEFVDAGAPVGAEVPYYVRAVQRDGHRLWMSPIWVRYQP